MAKGRRKIEMTKVTRRLEDLIDARSVLSRLMAQTHAPDIETDLIYKLSLAIREIDRLVDGKSAYGTAKNVLIEKHKGRLEGTGDPRFQSIKFENEKQAAEYYADLATLHATPEEAVIPVLTLKDLGGTIRCAPPLTNGERLAIELIASDGTPFGYDEDDEGE